MDVKDLATNGARASTDMVLLNFFRHSLNIQTERLKLVAEKIICMVHRNLKITISIMHKFN